MDVEADAFVRTPDRQVYFATMRRLGQQTDDVIHRLEQASAQAT